MVEVTLRKANQLQHQALDAAKKLIAETTLKISVFDQRPIEEVIDNGRAKLRTSVSDALDLIDAAYAIRASAASEWREVGIDKLLLERAMIETKERQLVVVTTAEAFDAETMTYGILEDKRKAARARQDNAASSASRIYGTVDETISVDLMTKEDKDEFEVMLASVRKRKAAIVDELMKRNLTGTIVIPAHIVEILTRHKIDV